MILVDEALALTEFSRLARPDECPALTPDEVIDILARFKRAELWTASTAFNLGDVVVPTLANRNGCRYRAVEYSGGQSTGATEPSWGMSRDAQITDGSVVWQEDGYDWDGRLWDIQAAAYESWMVKAGKASQTSDFQTDALNVSSSQLYDHCISQADRFRSVACV